MEVFLYLIIIVIAVLTEGFFSGAETAITSANKIRLRHLVQRKDKNAVRLSHFLEKGGMFIATTLVGTNIAVVTASAFATKFVGTFVQNRALVAFVSTVLVTSLVLLFGEVIPKVVCRKQADRLSLMLVGPIVFFYRLFFPIIKVVTFFSNIFLIPLNKLTSIDALPRVTKKELKSILKNSRTRGLVEPDEERFIYRILDFKFTKAKQVMIPIEKAVCLNAGESVAALKEVANKSGFSRIPIYENTRSNIIGIINIYDVLFDEGKLTLKNYLRQPVRVLEDWRVADVLAELQRRKQPMGIVIDFNGSSKGIITIEDLVEEIVGEIEG